MRKKIIAVWLSLLVCFSVVLINAALYTTDIDPKQGNKVVSESMISPIVDEDVDQTVSEIPEGLTTEEWDEIQTLLQEASYRPTWHGASDVFVASNPKHGWDVTFDEGEVLVRPDVLDDWSWFLVPSGCGYKGNVLPLNQEPEVMVDEDRIEFRYGEELTGWYLNDEQGLEHGFNIEKPPQPGTSGDLIIEMDLDTSLTPRAVNVGEDIIFLDEKGEAVLTYGKLLVTDARDARIPSELELTTDPNIITISIDDSSVEYPLVIDPLLTSYFTKITTPDGTSDDRFGVSVSSCGDTFVVGARDKDIGPNMDQGMVYVFERNQGGADNWGQVTNLTAFDGAASNYFGSEVSISGDTIVVGAPNSDIGMGSAYIFERNLGGADNWGLITKLSPSDGAPGDQFASGVSISGDIVVIGAWSHDEGSNDQQGSAYVYERNNGGADNWGEVTNLTASDGEAGDRLGGSVSVSGDLIVVGAKWDDIGVINHQGSAYIFERNQGGADNWGEVIKLTASDGAADDYFGDFVCINVDTVVVGACWDDIGPINHQGSAYVFERNHGGADNWGQVRKLMASDGGAGDYFGGTISMSGDTIIVGAYLHEVNTTYNQGTAYMFERNYGGADNWGLVTNLTAPDGMESDHFAHSVSIDGNTIIIGSEMDDIGTNDDQGSVYIFVRTGDVWVEVNKLIASDGAEDDDFGVSVSISGDIIVVGAREDDVGSNIGQGSAYIFERNHGGADSWGEVTKLTASDGNQTDTFGNAVSISGDIIVVGAFLDHNGSNADQGAAYIFERNQGGADNWGEVTQLTASDGEGGDYFGCSVSICGDTVVVGADWDDEGAISNLGSAYVFERNQGGADNWGQVVKLTASDGAEWDHFGSSVSISGDTIVVGSEEDNVSANIDQGSAYVFDRNQGGADNWGEVTQLTASDGASEDYFGHSVSISCDIIVVGAYHDEVGTNIRQGSAYIFERNQGGADNWGEITKITGSETDTGDYFGISVSISGDTIAVGAYNDNVGVNIWGSAFVFKRNQGGADNWGEVAKLVASDGTSWESFGLSVSICGNTVVAGVPSDEVGGNSSQGSAYIYRLNYLNFSRTLPTITTADDTTADEESLYYVDYNAYVPDGAPLTWSLWTDADGWLTINQSTGIVSGTPDNSDVGSWLINVTVSNSSGGIDYTNFTLVVNNTIPNITTSDNTTATEDALYSEDYASDDDGQGTVTWSLWTDADGWLTINQNTGVLTGTPDNIDVGTWVLNVSVSDGNGGIDYSNFSLVVINAAPNITSSDIESAQEDAVYSVDYTSDDDDQGAITWELWTDADGWLTINTSTGVLSGIPNNSDVGSWTVNVTVNDGNGGIIWSNFTLIVNNVSPIIITVDNTTIDEDAPYSVDYNSGDYGQGTITWSIPYTDTDGWLTINSSSGVLSGTPDNSNVGSWIVNVSVSDGNGGIDSSNFSLVVFNVAPAITTSDNKTATEDAIYSVNYASNDDGQGTITWSITYTDTDGWLTINSSSGVLSGIPDNNDVGNWTVNLTVDDGNGGIGYSNFTLKVKNTPPIIMTEDSIYIYEDTLYSSNYSCNDDELGNIKWSLWTDTDGWLIINPETGVLSGTPDNTDVGLWTINVSVNDSNGGIAYSNFTLVVINAPPIIITAHNTTATEDMLYYVDYASEDDGQGIVSWDLWTNADGWLEINQSTGILYGTPDNSDVGTWTVNVAVLDGNHGIGYSNFTLMVLNTNDAPAINTGNINTTLEDVLYSVNYDAVDDDQDTLIWLLDTSAGWLVINSSNGILSGMPSATDAGSYFVNVSVSDGFGGYDFSNFTLVVFSDTDGDGITNSDDDDDDDDGYPDVNDTFPLDPTEWEDFDSDGIGDNADDDDDNDGYKDEEDEYPLNPSKWEEPDAFSWWSLIVGIIICLFLLLLIIAIMRRKPNEEVPDKVLMKELNIEESEKPIEDDGVAHIKENEKDAGEDEEVTFEEIEDEGNEPVEEEVTFEEIVEDNDSAIKEPESNDHST